MHSFVQPRSFLLLVVLFCLASTRYASAESANSTLSFAKRTSSSSHNGLRRRHSQIGDAHALARRDMMLYPGRRAPGASFTHFETGLGACGHFNVESDFIVAISHLAWEGGKHCGQTITITAKGKTAQAVIADECMGCPFNNVDLTNGLYRFFDPAFIGEFQGDWEYGSGAPPAKPPPPPPPPSSKKPDPPPPTSSKAHPTTTPKSSAHPTSSKASTTSAPITSTSGSSSVASSASSVATASVTPSAAPGPGNLGHLFDILVNVGGLVVQTVPTSSS